MKTETTAMGKALCRDCGRDFGLIFTCVTYDCGVNQTQANIILCDECLEKRENEEAEGGV